MVHLGVLHIPVQKRSPSLAIFTYDACAPLYARVSCLVVMVDSFNSAAVARTRIGGKSGGVLNDNLVEELGEVATEHVRRVFISQCRMRQLC